MFDTLPTYSRYRTLFLTRPMQVGEDVYALQMGLNKLGYNVGPADGILGANTANGILTFQVKQGLAADSKAGGATQQAIAMELALDVADEFDVPPMAFRGQLELESAFRLGNYSPLRPDHSYDAGVAQRNTKFTPAIGGFDPALSIHALGESIREHYNLFAGVAGQRRWALAQGAWNAPAFACYIAREEGAKQVATSMTLKPTSDQRLIFEAYVRHASAYLV